MGTLSSKDMAESVADILPHFNTGHTPRITNGR
jgi:hypothetical protein